MKNLLFGTAGIPITTTPLSTIEGVKQIKRLGLDCMEIEFVQGVYLNEEVAAEVAEIASASNIRLSVHAPYYVNLNAHEIRKVSNSKRMIFESARIGALCGAQSVVLHAGFYLGDSSEDTFAAIKEGLLYVINRLKEEDINIKLRPEVSGKGSQFGGLEEILNLCCQLEDLAPCIDFAHCHARSGADNSYPEFVGILEQIRNKLGDKALKDMHMHISGIAYGQRGERKHLTLKESDFNYTELLKALKAYSAEGSVICESPNLEEDALLLKATYEGLSIA